MNSIIETIKDFDYKPKYKKNNRLTSIIILTYNKLEYTLLCIESIRKFTKEGTYEIIVVDNNSTDETVKWLESQDDLKVIYNDKNLGFPKGCNQGINIAKGDNILLLNNDTIVTPNWLYNLDKALWSSTDIGAVGAITNSCSYYQSIEVTYSSIQEMFEFSSNINKYSKDSLEYRLKLVGFCIIIKKDVLDKIGLLDEKFSPGNYEDDDLSFRIVSSGYKLLLCRSCFVHHFGSVSFDYERNKKSFEILEINNKKFKKKWGFNSDIENIINFDMISKINQSVSDKFNVLQIGCGTGATLLEIKNKYKNANLYGIDINDKSLSICKTVTNNVSLGNLDNLGVKFPENNFDYIFFSNISSDVYSIDEVILWSKYYLKKGGLLLVEVKNDLNVADLISFFDSENINIRRKIFKMANFNSTLELNDFTIDNIIPYKIIVNSLQKDFIYNLSSLSNNKSYDDEYEVYKYLVEARYRV